MSMIALRMAMNCDLLEARKLKGATLQSTRVASVASVKSVKRKANDEIEAGKASQHRAQAEDLGESLGVFNALIRVGKRVLLPTGHSGATGRGVLAQLGNGSKPAPSVCRATESLATAAAATTHKHPQKPA